MDKSDTISTAGGNLFIGAHSITAGSLDTSLESGTGGQIGIFSSGAIDVGDIITTSSENGTGGALNISTAGSISTGNITTGSEFGVGAAVNLSTSNTIETGSITTTGGSVNLGQSTRPAASITVNGAIDTSSRVGNGGDINLLSEGNITTEDINTVSEDSDSSGGSVRLLNNGNIKTGNIETSSYGNGGNVYLSALSDTSDFGGKIEVYSIDSSAFDSGGNITLQASKTIRLIGSFLVSLLEDEIYPSDRQYTGSLDENGTLALVQSSEAIEGEIPVSILTSPGSTITIQHGSPTFQVGFGNNELPENESGTFGAIIARNTDATGFVSIRDITLTGQQEVSTEVYSDTVQINISTTSPPTPEPEPIPEPSVGSLPIPDVTLPIDGVEDPVPPTYQAPSQNISSPEIEDSTSTPDNNVVPEELPSTSGNKLPKEESISNSGGNSSPNLHNDSGSDTESTSAGSSSSGGGTLDAGNSSSELTHNSGSDTESTSVGSSSSGGGTLPANPEQTPSEGSDSSQSPSPSGTVSSSETPSPEGSESSVESPSPSKPETGVSEETESQPKPEPSNTEETEVTPATEEEVEVESEDVENREEPAEKPSNSRACTCPGERNRSRSDSKRVSTRDPNCDSNLIRQQRCNSDILHLEFSEEGEDRSIPEQLTGGTLNHATEAETHPNGAIELR